jgi:hypothetical protein
MTAIASSKWKLGDEVKSQALPGLLLRITDETGTANCFGIFGGSGNATSAYTNEGNDGYRLWLGRWSATVTWDRDSLCPPPENLCCVHVSEVLQDGIVGPRHGWLFTDQIQLRENHRGAHMSADEVRRIRQDVDARKHEIEQLRSTNARWRASEQEKVDSYHTQIAEIKAEMQRRVAALDQARQEALEALWAESNKRSQVVTEKEKECNALMFSHDHIHFEH